MEINQLKEEYNKFKRSGDYKDRFEQSKFVPFAREIIKEALKLNHWDNKIVTAFVQIFSPNCTFSNFQEKIEVISLEKSEYFIEQFKNLNSKGYVRPPKMVIEVKEDDKIQRIRELVSEAFNVETREEAVGLIKRYEEAGFSTTTFSYKNYSTLLHYVKPHLFPIVNRAIEDDLGEFELEFDNQRYSSYLSLFYKLSDSFEEQDFGLIDYFFYHINQDAFLSV